MAEDQPLGFFPRSSRSPTRWCPVSRGKPHSDFQGFCLHCEATPAPSFPGLDFCHPGFSPISVSSGRATTPSGAHLARAISSVPPSSPCAPPSLCQGTPQPVATPSTATTLQPLHSSPGQGCQQLISLVRRLTFQPEALQTEVHRMARALPLHLLDVLRPLQPHPVLPPQ